MAVFDVTQKVVSDSSNIIAGNTRVNDIGPVSYTHLDVYKRQEYGRIGGNLNQIARTLNEWHSPYPQLAGEVRAAVSDLAALKFEVLQKVGDAVGNIQTYQL